MIKINSQEELDIFLAIPNWEESFIREWYLLSPSYILPNNEATIAPDGGVIMRILICTTEPECPGVELFFEDVEEIYLSCRTDLNPVGNFRNDGISFSFHGAEAPDISCKSLYYRILDKSCWGWKIQYGRENVFDKSGFLIDNSTLGLSQNRIEES
jgi:hypothetical protein